MQEEPEIPSKVSRSAIIMLLLVIGFGILLVLKYIFSAKDSENKPEIDAGTENNEKSAPNPVVSEPISVPTEPKNHFPGSVLLKNQFSERKRKRISRKNMEAIFLHGELSLTEAVSALKMLGFGKSAAYEALSATGQFSAWLQFAPDGMISWKG